MSRTKIIGAVLFILLFRRLEAQENAVEKFKPVLQPYLRAQLWTVYSEGIRSGDEVTAARAAVYFRRVRAGLKGNLLPRLSCDLQLMMDYLGKPENLSTKGSATAGVKVWHLFLTWKMMPHNEWFNLTGGYFLPHVSREAATSLWTVSSLDKSEVSCYLRQFVIGRPNGMAPGFNLGGTGKIHSTILLYNVAIVTRQDATSIQRKNWSPVKMGHAMLTFGDPESASYKYTLSNNLLRKQKSISVGLGFSTQGITDDYKSTSTWSADLDVYWGAFKLNTEYDRLIRKNQTEYIGECWLARVSYNVFLKNGWLLEPAFMFEQFSSTGNYLDASYYDGHDRSFDWGLNLISKGEKIKTGLHYIDRGGDGSSNKYISGVSHPASYAVLAMQFML